MRIISQNGTDFPYEQIIISVDNDMVICYVITAMSGRYYCLGQYGSGKRADEVREEIIYAYGSGDSFYIMPRY